MANTIEIKLVKSLNGRLAKHKATAEARACAISAM